jgi:hypothetical protein
MTYAETYARPFDRIAVRTLCGLFAPRSTDLCADLCGLCAARPMRKWGVLIRPPCVVQSAKQDQLERQRRHDRPLPHNGNQQRHSRPQEQGGRPRTQTHLHQLLPTPPHQQAAPRGAVLVHLAAQRPRPPLPHQRQQRTDCDVGALQLRPRSSGYPTTQPNDAKPHTSAPAAPSSLNAGKQPRREARDSELGQVSTEPRAPGRKAA